jgi:hypothetical protein
MKIVVHIGPPKTGSTSIQKSFSASGKQLKRKNIYYYDRAQPMPMALSMLFLSDVRRPHQKLVAKVGSAENVASWSENCWQEFERDIDESRPELTVISSERFAAIQNVDGFIGRLRQRFDDIYVAAYIRDPVDLYVSVTQQKIRGGNPLCNLDTPQSFKNNSREALERYSNVVGADKMIVRNFDRKNLVDGDVVADFLDQLARIGPNCPIKSLRAQESIPAAAVAWLLVTNDLVFHRMEKKLKGRQGRHKKMHGFRTVNRALVGADDLKDYPKLKLKDPQMAGIIRSRADADCRWINENFLKDQVPLAVLAEQVELPKTTPERDLLHVRDWILGHMEDRGMVEVMKSLIDPKPKHRNKR